MAFPASVGSTIGGIRIENFNEVKGRRTFPAFEAGGRPSAPTMENAGVPRNHISQLMGHEDDNMALDVYSRGLAIEPLRESMRKLSYGEDVDNLIFI